MQNTWIKENIMSLMIENKLSRRKCLYWKYQRLRCPAYKGYEKYHRGLVLLVLPRHLWWKGRVPFCLHPVRLHCFFRTGGNCVIGGGSPWTKDGTKADLSLNLLARARAVSYIQEHPDCPEVHCAISCRIGSPEILVVFTDKTGNELLSYRENVTPAEVIREFNLQKPRFAEMCRKGLFAWLPHSLGRSQ